MSAVPIVFAVTDAMVQNSDFILPFDSVRKLQMGTGCDSAVSNAVVTRGHSKQQSTSSDQQPGDMSGTVNPSSENGGDIHPVGSSASRSDSVGGERDNAPENVEYPSVFLTNESDCKALVDEQQADGMLDPCWHMVSQNKGRMFVEDCILYHYDEVCGHQVMRLAHEAVVSGHLGNQKTSEHIRLNFFWPNMKRDILSYTSSCQPCQLKARAKRTDKVPITPIVRPTVPFVVCHADIIGPIEPSSAKGHKWALCIIDDCSRWPAVYLLLSVTAKATCDAFMELFSTTGWPEIVHQSGLKFLQPTDPRISQSYGGFTPDSHKSSPRGFRGY